MTRNDKNQTTALKYSINTWCNRMKGTNEVNEHT